MFLWSFFFSFIEAGAPSSAEQKAITRTKQFTDALNILGQAKGADVASVQPSIDTVKATFQDLLTMVASNLASRPELYDAQRYARQIMNFLLMVIFVDAPETAEKLMVLLSENRTDPEVAKQLVAAFSSTTAHQNMHAMLTSQEPATNRQSKFNKEQRAGLEERIRDFYTELYSLKPEILQAAKSNFNRNVAIGALALTIVGVIASVALGATLIGLPAALGLLASTIGGPGSMAVQAWQKHQAGESVEEAAPDIASTFTKMLETLEGLKLQIENLKRQVNSNCSNPTIVPSSKLDQAKKFFGRLGT
jgi:hypothetical protein